MRRAIIIIFLAFTLPALAAGTWTTLTVPTTRHAFSISYSDGPVIACGAQEVIKSADGITWSLKTTTSASYPCYAVHFPTSSTGYIVGADSNGSYLLGNRGRWWKSTNQGDSWSLTPQTFNGVTAANDYYDVFFSDNNTGWAAGWPFFFNGMWRPNVIKTTDGGATWAVKTTGIAVNDNAILFGLHFYNSSIGWVTGGLWAGAGKVYRTLDGGDNWTEQTTGSTQPFGDIFFLKSDYNHGFLCGWNGTMYKTDNGGDTWTNIPTSTTASLAAVTFINPDVGYAVGNQGKIIKSTDQGATWTQSTPGAGTETYTDVYFKDAFHGWITGNNGNVLGFGVAPTVSPAEGNPGWSGRVTITGDNFYARNSSFPAYNGFSSSSVSFGSGIVVNSLEVASATVMYADISILPTATAATNTVTITDPDNGGTCAANFTITTTPTGDSGPTISNTAVEGEYNTEIPSSTPGMSADVEDTGAAAAGKAIGQNVDGVLYIDTNNSYIINDPNTYEYYIDNYVYNATSATAGKLRFLIGDVKSVATGQSAGSLYSLIGTGASFMPVVSAQDTKYTRSYKEHSHRVSFKSSLATSAITMLPSPTRRPPFTIQIITPNIADYGPANLTINNMVGSQVSSIPITISGLRTNVIWDGRDYLNEYVANGIVAVNLLKNGVRARMKLMIAR